MVLIDIVLVALEGKDYPTFSYVVKDLRHRLIWFTFLFGGLVSKIFYNRIVGEKKKEITGLFAFFSIVLLLFVLGRNLETAPSLFLQLLLLVSGGFLAYRAWPQYQKNSGLWKIIRQSLKELEQDILQDIDQENDSHYVHGAEQIWWPGW